VLRHRGKNRTVTHNIKLAAVLSFVAGMVNICGVLSIGTLTTNVTGHFAYFAEEMVNDHYRTAFTFISYIGAFLAGAFIASFLSELVSLRKMEYSHVLPMLAETGILICAALGVVPAGRPVLLACSLLLAMGIQNSLVSRVSSSVVRTTHLTGMFTDLGIELSQLLFYTQKNETRRLKNSLLLRAIIISCFFAGGIIAGFMYQELRLKTLIFAALLVLCALVYDNLKYSLYFLKRKMRSGAEAEKHFG
jgi:uncharacterized membrane protein YoaK (UPF0700 family)